MLNNLVRSDWHGGFDEKYWLFLPDTAALDEARKFVEDVLSWREHAESPRVQDFNSKVRSSFSVLKGDFNK